MPIRRVRRVQPPIENFETDPRRWLGDPVLLARIVALEREVADLTRRHAEAVRALKQATVAAYAAGVRDTVADQRPS